MGYTRFATLLSLILAAKAARISAAFARDLEAEVSSISTQVKLACLNEHRGDTRAFFAETAYRRATNLSTSVQKEIRTANDYLERREQLTRAEAERIALQSYEASRAALRDQVDQYREQGAKAAPDELERLGYGVRAAKWAMEYNGWYLARLKAGQADVPPVLRDEEQRRTDVAMRKMDTLAKVSDQVDIAASRAFGCLSVANGTATRAVAGIQYVDSNADASLGRYSDATGDSRPTRTNTNTAE